jgi:hypothetical protein
MARRVYNPNAMKSLTATSIATQARASASKRTWRIVRRSLGLIFVCLLIVVLIPSNGELGAARTDFVIQQAIGGRGFRLAAWETQAIAQKARDLVSRPGAGLTPEAQHDLVITYFDALGRIDELSAKIEHIYADPNAADPAALAAPLQAELNDLRTTQAERRPAVEWIIEGQVAMVLAEAGLTTDGVVWPPVRFAFTESPDYLIVSPRDHIVVKKGVYLDPGISVSDMERIETQVAKELDVSALVDGTGGFSSYPTMVVAYPDLEWVLDTVAHEWTHTYLYFRPLGWHYGSSGGMRTINETIASIVGGEISRLTLQRFYPERVPPAGWPQPLSMSSDWLGKTADPPQFEYGAFMRKTRLEADRLLAEGKIDEAEKYMEAQRRILVENGYAVRKLNQAYFAFHGSYAVGSSATDPIGGKLRLLRRQAGSLAQFLQTVAKFSEPGDLDATLRQ